MKGTEALTQALRDRQQMLGEADGVFASRLGVSRQAWQMVRTGDTKPGERTLQGALRAFPELTPDVMALFLPRKASILNGSGKAANAEGT